MEKGEEKEIEKEYGKKDKTHASSAPEGHTCKESKEPEGGEVLLGERTLARAINEDVAPETGVGGLEGHKAHVCYIGQSSTSYLCSH
jgi:hypothetical protein